MANMGYCRFEKTLHGLLDCFANWDDVTSESEAARRRRLVWLCRLIVSYHDDAADSNALGVIVAKKEERRG